MSIELVVEVLDYYHGPDAKKLWLLAFAEKANGRTREGWPGREILAHRTGRSRARVSNIATELVEDGVLKRVGGGGRHRGEARYVLLPLSVDTDPQGSDSTNPDNPSQGSARANSDPVVQGSESDSQGSESGPQGSAISPLPAETSHILQIPHINQPSSLSSVERAARRLLDCGGTEREIRHIADKMIQDPKVRYPAAYLTKAIEAGDGPVLLAQAQKDLAALEALQSMTGTNDTSSQAAEDGARSNACRMGNHKPWQCGYGDEWCTCSCHRRGQPKRPGGEEPDEPQPIATLIDQMTPRSNGEVPS